MNYCRFFKTCGTRSVLFLIIVTAMAGFLFPEVEVNVLKKVVPTMKEKTRVRLVKVKEVDAELGNDRFLFSPISLIGDHEKYIYIYARAQNQIYKMTEDLEFVTAFGRHGQGPGEFMGKGSYHMVFLNVGLDKNIYANDLKGRRVLVFSSRGKVLRHSKYTFRSTYTPVVDKHGSIIQYKIDKGNLIVFNEKKEILFTYPLEEKGIDYLYYDQRRGNRIDRKRKPLLGAELKIRMSHDGRLLLFFPASVVLWVIKDKKVEREIKIWPENALKAFKAALNERIEKSPDDIYLGYLFSRFFRDGDDENCYYFRMIRDKKNKRDSIYRVNLNGELTTVLDLKAEGDNHIAIIQAKQNNRYYALDSDDKVIIYMEEKKK